jgi:hypothetical protein
LASKVFAGERGTVPHTIAYVVADALIFMGLFLVANAASPKGSDIVDMVSAITSLVLLFWVPMRIYEISFFRALGLVITSYILAAIATTSVWLLMGIGMLTDFNPSHFALHWHQTAKIQATPADLSNQVNQLHVQLQRDRATLNLSDSAAVAKFNQRVAEYNELRSKLASVPR